MYVPVRMAWNESNPTAHSSIPKMLEEWPNRFAILVDQGVHFYRAFQMLSARDLRILGRHLGDNSSRLGHALLLLGVFRRAQPFQSLPSPP